MTAELRPLQVPAQSLADLVAGLSIRLSPADADLEVTGIELDSRSVRPGDLYLGLPGLRTHGARFAEAAAQAGAVAMLTDIAGRELAGDVLPVLTGDGLRALMAQLAARLYGHPTRNLLTFAITGTNGKTTTLHLLTEGLRALGRRVGSIGTIGFYLDGEALPAARTTITTPESPDLQALFAVMSERGADAIAMEVSSHALALDRVAATHFDVAGFTNLGRDHLDFHRTQENYFEAKARLFTPELTSGAVVNIDDEAGRQLIERCRSVGAPAVWSTGMAASADYRIIDWQPLGQGGSLITADLAGQRVSFPIALPGEHNVRNAVLALAMIDRAGLDANAAIAGISPARVPGRMEPVELGPGAPQVYVDFAHTPQAISSALRALPTPLIAVLGAGGDRDAAKRGEMGQAAAAAADVVIITDDNPRHEDPKQIREALLAGARAEASEQAAAGRPVHVLDGGDRARAIAVALQIAGQGHAVAILGKGHEKTQEIDGVFHHFDDVETIRSAWEASR